jgi:hypothetical protein
MFLRLAKHQRIIASFLLINFLTFFVPIQSKALTSGPSQPETQQFAPAGMDDMVDPFTGDFSYNIPLMDVGGYPINLNYASGITPDAEASWVGLGWNLNVGAINRSVRGLPDDFAGDEVTTDFNIKPNQTYGVKKSISLKLFGAKTDALFKASLGVNSNVFYNNYNGMGISMGVNPSVSAARSNDSKFTANLGVNLGVGSESGIDISPTLGISPKEQKNKTEQGLTASIGFPFNTREGLKGMTLSVKPEQWKQARSTYQGFSTPTYTPSIQQSHRNYSFSTDVAFEYSTTVTELPSVGAGAYYSGQFLTNTSTKSPAYGYMYSGVNNSDEKLYDINREKEGTYHKKYTQNLPLTNYTYDIFQVSGQGVGGTYRLHRGDIGTVSDPAAADRSIDANTNFAVGVGYTPPNMLTMDLGFGLSVTGSNAQSGKWTSGDRFISTFDSETNINNPQNEIVYFKKIGESTVENNPAYFNDVKRSTALMQYGLFSPDFGIASNTYTDGSVVNESARNTRPNKTTAFTVLTATEAGQPGAVTKGAVLPIENHTVNSFQWTNQLRAENRPGSTAQNLGYTKTIIDRVGGFRKGHHISEVRVTDQSGARYVYGIAAYNNSQEEITFAVSTTDDLAAKQGIINSGLVSYDPQNDLGNKNQNGLDNYYNCVSTPANAHSYLLTCILSSDYIDSDGIQGPSSGDLGTYTKFNYAKLPATYAWRTPMTSDLNIASFSEGMVGTSIDDKANIVYGKKEVWYLHSIETPTHIAEFHMSERLDGFGAQSREGGIGNDALLKLDKIVLYSIADKMNSTGEPIKTVHFSYSYKLCPKTINSKAPAEPENLFGQGKLTLNKVWFTYGNSQKGVLNPYVFVYADQNFDGEIDNGTNGRPNLNPNYSHLNYDRWGTFKATDPNPNKSNALFPYTRQEDKTTVDRNAAVYALSTIKTPTGGAMHVVYESDDYAYVQDKKAMRMFNLAGGNAAADLSITGTQHFIEIDLNEGFVPKTSDPDAEFRELYIGDLSLMYFKINMNVVNGSRFEYVPGYAEINKMASELNDPVDGVYKTARIALTSVKSGLNPAVNPIPRAGWMFAKQNLNRELKGLGTAEDSQFDAIIKALLSQANSMASLTMGFTREMINNGHSSKYIPSKSIVKLYEPDQIKLGGGHRVKAIIMSDNWSLMKSGKEARLNIAAKQTSYYGQKYDYTKSEGTRIISSGVAAYEPILGGEENPFRRPVFVVEKVPLAVDNEYFLEEPFGESFFPSASVGYSKVVVTPLKITETDFINKNFRGNGTGRVEQEFYTAKDFPTSTQRTGIKKSSLNPSLITKFMKLGSMDLVSCTQGYYIETNDMHGKPKSKKVYPETNVENPEIAPQPISEVEYRYKTAGGKLDNQVRTISPDLSIPAQSSILGLDVDVVHDQREFETTTLGGGVNVNVKLTYAAPIAAVVTPIPFPDIVDEFVQFRSLVTTKVVNRTAILEETIARDNGAEISTKNLAWDAKTGEVILTSLQNEFHDPIYTFNYPAHWAYTRMGLASKTEGMRFKESYFYANTSNFNDGDELLIDYTKKGFVNFDKTSNQWSIIDKEGTPITNFLHAKVIRSGARNMAAAPIGTVVMLTNPIQNGNIVFANVINAGASEYKEEWKRMGCDCPTTNTTTNPYVLGLKGNLRPYRSWTYLTDRFQKLENNQMNIRTDGFYKDFAAFWQYREGLLKTPSNLNAATNKWQYVTEITNYNPLGLEIENKDALSRYLMAQYGYARKLPVATSNNSKYRESGFDGFEDYGFNDCLDDHFSWRNATNNVTDSEAHTGRKSIRVGAGQSLDIKKVISPCE